MHAAVDLGCQKVGVHAVEGTDASGWLAHAEEQGYEIESSLRIILQEVSQWSYTMPMVGKLGIIVSICNEEQLLITTKYLMK